MGALRLSTMYRKGQAGYSSTSLHSCTGVPGAGNSWHRRWRRRSGRSTPGFKVRPAGRSRSLRNSNRCSSDSAGGASQQMTGMPGRESFPRPAQAKLRTTRPGSDRNNTDARYHQALRPRSPGAGFRGRDRRRQRSVKITVRARSQSSRRARVDGTRAQLLNSRPIPLS